MKELIFFTLLSSYVLNIFPDTNQKFRPPGTIEVVDNFFIDEKELTNLDWKEYVDYQKRKYGKDAQEYKSVLPDTTVWLVAGFDNAPFVNTYYSHPSYNNYPVVGISYNQAKVYCVWRTERVKENVKPYGIKANFEYRLPTRTEWELVAKAGYTNKQIKLLRKQKEKYGYNNMRNCNMINNVYPNSSMKEIRMLAPSRSYLPNKYLVYNMYGNVAEMVEEENIAMGGSFLDEYEEIVPSHKAINYDSPQRWLGFRCVGEVLEK